MKRSFFLCFLIILSMFSFSGCGLSGIKSEDEIIDEINKDIEEYFWQEDISVKSLTIDKRLTNKDDKEDTVYATVLFDVYDIEVECEGVINYLLYNDGWEIDSIEMDYSTARPLEAPKEEANNYLNDLIDAGVLGLGNINSEFRNMEFNEEFLTSTFTYDLTRENETAKFTSKLDLRYSFMPDNLMWGDVQYVNYDIESTLFDSTIQSANSFINQYASEDEFNYTYENYEYNEEDDKFLLNYTFNRDKGNLITTVPVELSIKTDTNGEYTEFRAKEIYSDVSLELKDVTGKYKCTEHIEYDDFVEEPCELTIHSCDDYGAVISFSLDEEKYDWDTDKDYVERETPIKSVSVDLYPDDDSFNGEVYDDDGILMEIYIYEDEITCNYRSLDYLCNFPTKIK